MQKKVILKATKEYDYCAKANRRTLTSLVEKGLARWTEGFGHRFGGIIELTDKGKEMQSKLINTRSK